MYKEKSHRNALNVTFYKHRWWWRVPVAVQTTTAFLSGNLSVSSCGLERQHAKQPRRKQQAVNVALQLIQKQDSPPCPGRKSFHSMESCTLSPWFCCCCSNFLALWHKRGTNIYILKVNEGMFVTVTSERSGYWRAALSNLAFYFPDLPPSSHESQNKSKALFFRERVYSPTYEGVVEQQDTTEWKCGI